jgi:hypothetical protein
MYKVKYIDQTHVVYTTITTEYSPQLLEGSILR